MWKLSESLTGSVTLEAVGANPAEFLGKCAAAGIILNDCVPVDAYTVRLKAAAKHRGRLEQLLGDGGFSAKTIKIKGAAHFISRAKKRAALLIGLAAALVGLLVSSFFVWEIDVTGNEEISSGEILRVLELCGVSYGTFWPGIDQAAVRNNAIAMLPELSFLTVNVSGSRAEVVVRERTPKPELFDASRPIDIIASKDGIIAEIRAYEGAVKTEKGKTVVKGDVLVSGEAMSFAGLRYEHARADVFARTWYDITAAAPLFELKKSYTGGEYKKFSLIFGEKQINLFSGTGIKYAEYDKITDSSRLSVPGVFILPFAVNADIYSEYTVSTVVLDENAVRKSLEQQLLAKLRDECGGEITSYNYTSVASGDWLYVTIHAECYENIAEEKIIIPTAEVIGE